MTMTQIASHVGQIRLSYYFFNMPRKRISSTYFFNMNKSGKNIHDIKETMIVFLHYYNCLFPDHPEITPKMMRNLNFIVDHIYDKYKPYLKYILIKIRGNHIKYRTGTLKIYNVTITLIELNKLIDKLNKYEETCYYRLNISYTTTINTLKIALISNDINSIKKYDITDIVTVCKSNTKYIPFIVDNLMDKCEYYTELYELSLIFTF